MGVNCEGVRLQSRRLMAIINFKIPRSVRTSQVLSMETHDDPIRGRCRAVRVRSACIPRSVLFCSSQDRGGAEIYSTFRLDVKQESNALNIYTYGHPIDGHRGRRRAQEVASHFLRRLR